MVKINLQGIMRSKITSALMVLALLMLFNLFFTKNFFVITVRDGHLFGTLIDILNRGAPLMLLSMGMTLVIASTGGVDLSVGAVTAITAAMVSKLIGGQLIIVDGVQSYMSQTRGSGSGENSEGHSRRRKNDAGFVNGGNRSW